ALTLGNPAAVPVRTFEHTGTLALHTEGTALKDVEVVLVTVDGKAPSFGSGQVAGLGSVAPSGDVLVEHDAAPAVLAAQGAEESVAAYLDRLRSRDGSSVPTSGWVKAR